MNLCLACENLLESLPHLYELVVGITQGIECFNAWVHVYTFACANGSTLSRPRLQADEVLDCFLSTSHHENKALDIGHWTLGKMFNIGAHWGKVHRQFQNATNSEAFTIEHGSTKG